MFVLRTGKFSFRNQVCCLLYDATTIMSSGQQTKFLVQFGDNLIKVVNWKGAKIASGVVHRKCFFLRWRESSLAIKPIQLLNNMKCFTKRNHTQAIRQNKRIFFTRCSELICKNSIMVHCDSPKYKMRV